jgi:hypothetical protein
MTCNIGKIDKIVRVIVGVAIAVLGFYFKSWWGLLALIPLLTAAIGFCPLYVPFKISTVGKKKEGE